MRATGKQSRGLVRRRMVALLAIIVTAAIAASILSCRYQCSQPSFRRPMYIEGVPVVRVRVLRLNESASISTTGAGKVLVDGQVVMRSDRPVSMIVRRSDNKWRFAARQAKGRELEIVADGNSRVRVGDKEYRGWLRLVAIGRDQFLVVNYVDMENYLAGVLGKELYPQWSDETYRALCIAARSFALYKKTNASPSRMYDLTDTPGSQVYGGVAAESDRSWRAVRSTHGKVLTWNSNIFLTQYSASCGGTVNDAAVLRNISNTIPPLSGGQRCDDCSPCPRYRWPKVTISKKVLHNALSASRPRVAALRGISKIRVVARTSYGRILKVELIGPTGRKATLLYDHLRTSLLMSGAREAKGLQSMNCNFKDLGSKIEFYDGKGFGHGVGLCQWGAEGKARKGWSAERIIGFYYTGATIVRKY